MIEIVKPSWDWTELAKMKLPFITKHLEECGRTCYKSERSITDDSADKFVEKICRNRHESVLEHEVLTARIVCSRAASHQLVRHRIASYSQESQRYCNYGKKGLQVICPPSIGLAPGVYDWYNTRHRWIEKPQLQCRWVHMMEVAYTEYLQQLEEGVKPEDARYVLPNATKTELAVTFNLSMWRHVIKTRCDKHAQWEIRGIFTSIRDDLKQRLPAVFGDLE